MNVISSASLAFSRSNYFKIFSLLVVLAGVHQPAYAQAQGGGGSEIGQLIFMMAVIFVLFYVIILRPQKKEQQAIDQMRENLKEGDKVKTIGGAYGTIASIDKNTKTVKLEFEKGNRIKFDRAAIAAVIKEAKETSGHS
jgi:preprotein translocase subunit YajC